MELVGPFEKFIFESSRATNIAECAAEAKLQLVPVVWFLILVTWMLLYKFHQKQTNDFLMS